MPTPTPLSILAWPPSSKAAAPATHCAKRWRCPRRRGLRHRRTGWQNTTTSTASPARDGGAGRRHRRRHRDDPRRLGRRDAAQPRAAGHRRAVRHAGHAVPGRIDLGLGRAPGTDGTPRARCAVTCRLPGRTTFRAMSSNCSATSGRRARADGARDPGPGHARADLAAGVELVQCAARGLSGLPFAFASHFAPAMLDQALECTAAATGRRRSAKAARDGRPQRRRRRHRRRGGAALHVAQLRFLGMQRGERGPLPRPIDPAAFAAMGSPAERAGAESMLALS